MPEQRCHERGRFLRIIAGAVRRVPGLLLLDRHNVPSQLLHRYRLLARRLGLTLRPIVISDEEVLSSMCDWPECPADLRAALFDGTYLHQGGHDVNAPVFDRLGRPLGD